MIISFVIAVIGFIAAEIVNYFSDVLPTRRRIAKPFCSTCEENINLRNYFLWPRKCPHCGNKRILRIWIVDLVIISSTYWIWYTKPSMLHFIIGLIILIYFGIVTVIDIEYRLILHTVSITGAIIGFGVGLWMHGLRNTLLGGFAGFGLMLLIYLFGILFVRFMSRIRGSSTNIDEALGFGDVNLSGVIGLLIGWPGIVAVLFLSIILSGLVSLIYLIIMVALRRYRTFMAIPYGPFLVFSAAILLFFAYTIGTIFG